ncbi:hypothetical protein M1545_03500 [Patescibacteria group bacterium]|nr:hypothetical protein [Patescibacteria group bacterium]
MPENPANITSKSTATFLFGIITAILILMLSVLNLETFSRSLKDSNVLGVNIEADQREFWYSFLESNPSYLPGWLELVRLEDENGNEEGKIYAMDKAFQIDPNWEKTQQ